MGCFLFLVLAAFVLALSATISGSLIYAGWNWGVLAAFPSVGLGALTFWQAVCVGFIISVIGGAFRRVRSKSK
jgi:hypothetical protein